MSELYEMALTAVVGVAVLYAITRPEKPVPPAPRSVKYEPAPLVVSPPPAEAPSTPVQKQVEVAATPIAKVEPASSTHQQLETPSFMTNNKESTFHQQEPVHLSIIPEDAPSWISRRPVAALAEEDAPVVPSWMSSREPTPKHHGQEEQATKLACLNYAVTHTAYVESDAVFVYPLGTSAFLGDRLRAQKHKVHFVETREGAGEMVQGAAAQAGKKVSVLMSSQSIRPMIPAIKRMVHDKQGVAFHVSLLQEEECGIQADHSALSVVRSLPGVVVLCSTTPEEAETLAKTAVLLAQKLSRPVFHVIDHVDLNVRVLLQHKVANAFAELPQHSFHYSGSKDAKVVFVAMGHAANEAESFVALNNGAVGSLRVRVLRPWSAEQLIKSLPASVTRVCVLDQTGDALSLFTDVAKSFATQHSAVQVSFVKVPASFRGVNAQLIHSACHELGVVTSSAQAQEERQKTVVIFAAAQYKLNKVELAHCTRVATHVDYFADVSLTEVRIGAPKQTYTVVEAGQAQVVALHGDVEHLFDSGIDLLAPLVERNGTVLIPSGQEVPAALLRKIKAKQAHLSQYDANSAESALHCALQAATSSAAGRTPNGDVHAFHEETASRRIKGDVFASSSLQDVSSSEVASLPHAAHTESSLFGLVPRLAFAAPHNATDGENHHQNTTMLNTTVRNEDKEFEVISRQEIARSLVFKDAFETKAAVVENHKEETFLVKMVLRKRLTPLAYDRNIFHLEFDIAGTELKYNIGDALGVFAHNDVNEVDDLIAKCGFDGNAFVAFNTGEKSEFISVRNLLIQHLDIFGRPSKKFYLWLSNFATSNYEQLKLSHAGTDDAEAFKLGVSETLTFADLLLQHPSARPGMEELMQVVPRIKARHYSIASSMKFTPRSVSLLIVEVDWVTPKGRKRHGQCTRYLANLPINSTVRVDVVPSVLRLPPSPEQPIVMAGLGTGMAPFRAFVQERKFQKESGIKVGPIVLYFGARHRSEEWLYGEEWDQYLEEGLVTRLGLAFSRDQQEKIYIQHRIQEDATLLHDLFLKQQGYFFLCGPTWPVPDVRDAVAMGLDPVNAKQGNTEIVEKLKEEGRYILEVY